MLNKGFKVVLTLAGILLLTNSCSSPEKPQQTDAPAGSLWCVSDGETLIPMLA